MNIPRNEYPRPQLVRSNWTNLNGTWEFEFDFGASGRAREMQNQPFSKQILVPFVPESKLSGIEYTDFIAAVWYRRTFEAKVCPETERLLLHFGAVDFLSEVYINGVSVGTHRGGYTPFVFDITEYVKDGENTLVVYAEDDTRSPLQATGKQSIRYENAGCHYTRSTGIWQTVWLETVPRTYVCTLKMTPDVDNGKLDVLVTAAGDTKKLPVCAKVSFAGEPVAQVESILNSGLTASFSIPIPDAKLWNPGEPNLYDLELTVGEDTVQSYFGMRKVAINGYAIEINDRPIFQRLVLDQGYYPTGIYTAPTDEDLRRDVEMSMAAGFNGARLHMKVFEPRLIYWADQLGYLLWGEYPNWGLDDSNPAILGVVLPEWLEELERDYNSPAIIGWCPFNETSERRHPDVPVAMYRVTHAIDPMRPVIDTSGYTHVEGYTDIYDVHNYTQEVDKFHELFDLAAFESGKVFTNRHFEVYDPKLPYFVSEFGGTYWDLDKNEKAWGYGNAPKTIDELYERLEGLVKTLLDNPRICAYCYTQLTDVYQEKNGIYAFDRRVKFDMERIRAIFGAPAAIEKQD